jgi:hypothetical protein
LLALSYKYFLTLQVRRKLTRIVVGFLLDCRQSPLIQATQSRLRGPNTHVRQNEFVRESTEEGMSSFRGTLKAGRRTGRSLPEGWETRFAGGGKSELRRAVCRITSGTWASKPMDGQCHRKDTASATPPRFFGSGRRASLETQYPSWPGLPGTPAVAETPAPG